VSAQPSWMRTQLRVIGVGPRTSVASRPYSICRFGDALPCKCFSWLFIPITVAGVLVVNAITPGRALRTGPFAFLIELREVVVWLISAGG